MHAMINDDYGDDSNDDNNDDDDCEYWMIIRLMMVIKTDSQHACNDQWWLWRW